MCKLVIPSHWCPEQAPWRRSGTGELLHGTISQQPISCTPVAMIAPLSMSQIAKLPLSKDDRE